MPTPSRTCRESWIAEPISAPRGKEKNSASCTFACKDVSEGQVEEARAKMRAIQRPLVRFPSSPSPRCSRQSYQIIRLARIAPLSPSSPHSHLQHSPRLFIIRAGDSDGLTAEFSPTQPLGSRSIALVFRPAEVKVLNNASSFECQASMKPLQSIINAYTTQTPIPPGRLIDGPTRRISPAPSSKREPHVQGVIRS